MSQSQDPLAELLPESQVRLHLRVAGKAALLAELARIAATATGLEAKQISAALAAREALGSTGFGHGIAVPHARLDGISTPFCLLATLDRKVVYDAVDGQKVDIVFLLLTAPTDNNRHLSLLAAATRRLRRPDTLAALRAAGESGEVIRVLNQV